MLIDPHTRRLLPAIDDVLGRMDGNGRVQAEFRAAQVEIASRPCLSAGDAGRELAFARLELADTIADRVRPLACGVHPTAHTVGPLTEGERYATIAVDKPWAARYLLTCGLHVHVAVADADRALAVYNALRSDLPELAALAANSPVHRSVDTGAASTRHQLNRYLARHGVPLAFRDWNAYLEFTARGRAGGSIPDPSYHWWDLRLHPAHGTLDIRACDAQTDVADAASLAGWHRRSWPGSWNATTRANGCPCTTHTGSPKASGSAPAPARAARSSISRRASRSWFRAGSGVARRARTRGRRAGHGARACTSPRPGSGGWGGEAAGGHGGAGGRRTVGVVAKETLASARLYLVRVGVAEADSADVPPG